MTSLQDSDTIPFLSPRTMLPVSMLHHCRPNQARSAIDRSVYPCEYLGQVLLATEGDLENTHMCTQS